MKIGVAATASVFLPEIADAVTAVVAGRWPDGAVELVFHPDAYQVSGHFAGDDETRGNAFVDLANDPSIDAIWFGRGGYGSNRIAEAAIARLNDAARGKTYLGYSDAGFLLAGLYRAGFKDLAHGPMAGDIRRENGRAAVDRALDWLTDRAPSALEPHLDGRPTVAFNLVVLDQLVGTPLEPDLSGHVLMLEDVDEELYRVDRMLFHLTSQASIRRVAGIRMGRVAFRPNDTADFGMTADEIARHWCQRSGIPYLGAADIGHDADNKVVPFGPRP